jgi:hypothetical protein
MENGMKNILKWRKCKMNICEKLSNIQNELKAPKGQFNKFGGYKYRSCEDILEAVKPICKKNKTTLVISDALENIGDRYYVKATATLYNNEPDKNGAIQKIENTSYAREEESKKGMDGSQITGTASSYARKYALNGLFNIDDTKDADTDEFTKQTQIDDNKKISNTQIEGLNKSIENAKISDEIVYLILGQYGYSSTNEIKVKDYMNIVNDLKSKK